MCCIDRLNPQPFEGLVGGKISLEAIQDYTEIKNISVEVLSKKIDSHTTELLKKQGINMINKFLTRTICWDTLKRLDYWGFLQKVVCPCLLKIMLSLIIQIRAVEVDSIEARRKLLWWAEDFSAFSVAFYYFTIYFLNITLPVWTNVKDILEKQREYFFTVCSKLIELINRSVLINLTEIV